MSESSVTEFTTSLTERATVVMNFIRGIVPTELHYPKVAVICGSGLHHLADALNILPRSEIPFSDLPYFPLTTVEGHIGKLVFGHFGTVPAVCMVGRIHFYEGNPFDISVFPVRLFSVMGISTLLVTNAAGGLNSEYKVGDLMVLNDHINFPGLAGWHPLKGPNDPLFGPRFLALSDAYDLELRRKVFESAKALKLSRRIHEGVYVFVSGPTYETRAESRMLKMLGADAVGMSTVPEIIVARHCGMKVLAISLVTNAVVTAPTPKASDGPANLSAGRANHEEVIEAARQAGDDMRALVLDVISKL
ncbi:nucleoside phosphorylase domain-containing protein [Lipomyces orientalis]|uniref:Nucleoside phosphorylase domain-containing protein n=1 Tax=Lipomyces orientalis TaxID=1233043 RepID=A0ACC3TV06_9ASCO